MNTLQYFISPEMEDKNQFNKQQTDCIIEKQRPFRLRSYTNEAYGKCISRKLYGGYY